MFQDQLSGSGRSHSERQRPSPGRAGRDRSQPSAERRQRRGGLAGDQTGRRRRRRREQREQGAQEADAGDVGRLRQQQRRVARRARAKVQQERADRRVHNAAAAVAVDRPKQRVHRVPEGRRRVRRRGLRHHDVLHVAETAEVDVLHVPHVRAGEGPRQEGPGLHDRRRQRLAEGGHGHIHQEHLGERTSGGRRTTKTRYVLVYHPGRLNHHSFERSRLLVFT